MFNDLIDIPSGHKGGTYVFLRKDITLKMKDRWILIVTFTN